MSRRYDTVEPSVISEEMLLTAVEEQRPKDEKGKKAKHDDIEFDEVKSLRLDYKSKCFFTIKKSSANWMTCFCLHFIILAINLCFNEWFVKYTY